jgi:diguanylate cyclase (GGDEF)-like protein/PAS domain S-box-containing protein
LTGVCVLIAGLLVGVVLGGLDGARKLSDARSRTIAELATIQAQLDGVLKQALSGSEGIVHLIQHQGDLSQDLFDAMAEQAITNHGQIRNIAYAPNNVIAMIHPLAGNEKAFGLDYRSVPEQWNTVEQAMRTGVPVLSGPVSLVQGGAGIIVRAPVVLRPDGISGRSGYWGTVSIVGDIERILLDGGVTRSAFLRVAIRGKDGLGELGEMITGDPAVFSDDPVKTRMGVPGGHWVLAATPVNGWPRQAVADSPYFVGALVNSMVLACLAGLLVSRHRQLRERHELVIEESAQRRQSEEALRLASTVVECTADGVMVTDRMGAIIATNPAFTEITGYSADEVKGRNPNLLKSDRQQPEFYQAMWRSIDTVGGWQGEIWNRRKNGEIYPEWLTISAVRNASGDIHNLVGVFSDISTIKRTQEDLERLAHFDPLTGLPNRVLFHDRMQHALDRAVRYRHKIGVLLLDLDGFKTINDSLGHPVGDQLLQLVAERLGTCVRVEDTVARLGGDEFAVILSELGDGADAIEVIHRILSAIQVPFEMSGGNGMVTTSIGVAVFPDDGPTVTELIRNADAAMYEAKAAGRNTYRFYQRNMTEEAQKRLQVENALRRAVEKREFEVWFQPQFSLGSCAYLGAEALVRWRDPEHGLIAPADFIPLAERSGLIIPLGEQVLEMVAMAARRWLDAGLSVGRLGVNVAGPQIDRSDFVATLRRVIATWNLPPSLFEIEITETVIMENPDHGRRVLNEINALGVTTAIDDFGTGYSSLAYLKELPIGTIKLDRAFVKDLPDHPSDIAISRAVIALGHNLGFKVIAEGIETEAQRSFLHEEGCDEGQGYLFARPMPADVFEAWLVARRSSAAPINL